ncbi:hypothetical protein AU194_08250 [Mycobacterium sp. GA-2829]|nr:hypothetical protein AU194_08250 [Mycobacterium sp. GA-2829]
MDTHAGPGPLAGIRVLEVASNLAAPFAGRLLGDLGAEVVKVEDVEKPDASRSWLPMKGDTAMAFLGANSGKKSIGINLRTPRGRELLAELSQHFDVLIEAFRPGRFAKWGLDSQTLRRANPGLVVLHISGFGQTGPDSARPGFGTVAEAVSGFAYVNGWPQTPPTSAPFGLCDHTAGLAGAFAVSAALRSREVTGKGDDVDVALYEPMMGMLADMILAYSSLGEVQERAGNTGVRASPRGIYETADGKWVAIAGSSQSNAIRLFDAMGRSDLTQDPRFATNEARVANDEELNEILADWAKTQTRDVILKLLTEFEVASGPVNNATDIVEGEHFRQRGSVIPFLSRELGPLMGPGPMARFGEHAQMTSRPDAPSFGEHTTAILTGDLGLDETAIAELKANRIIA